MECEHTLMRGARHSWQCETALTRPRMVGVFETSAILRHKRSGGKLRPEDCACLTRASIPARSRHSGSALRVRNRAGNDGRQPEAIGVLSQFSGVDGEATGIACFTDLTIRCQLLIHFAAVSPLAISVAPAFPYIRRDKHLSFRRLVVVGEVRISLS